jgi:hypothetical protein
MHALVGALYLLADSTLTPEQIQHLELITASSNLLQSLILDLLDFSAVHTGRLVLATAPASVLELVEAVVPTCGFPAVAKGVDLCYWVEPQCMLRQRTVDRARVEQIMLHLLSNAIKFTPAGGNVRLTISSHNLSEPGMDTAEPREDDETNALCLVVSDTGTGMPAHSLADLLLPFGHARQCSQTQGLGVGLSVVWRLVDAMDGSIACDSVQGRGTSFKVCLPAPCTGEVMATLDNPFGLADEDRAVLAHSHIVIVAADVGSADSWSRLLGLYGVRVLVFEHLEEAKEYVKHQSRGQGTDSASKSSSSDNVSITRCHHSPIDLVILDGYHEIIKHCQPNVRFREADGFWCADRNPPHGCR